MHQVVEVEADILRANRAIAERNREILNKNRVLAIDVSGAIGSGKTSLIEQFVLRSSRRAGVVAGDVLARFDASRFKKLGIPVHELNTGKECHLDAHLVSHALEKLPLSKIDVLFLENVGNLICPADFDLGAHIRVVVVSVTEGEDTVEKHPRIFLGADLAVINKIDLAEFVDVSPEKMASDAKKINPNIDVLLTSVKRDINIDRWVDYVESLL